MMKIGKTEELPTGVQVLQQYFNVYNQLKKYV